MTVKRWWCARHGYQPPEIVGRDDVPRCPECGQRMDLYEYGAEGPGTVKR